MILEQVCILLAVLLLYSLILFLCDVKKRTYFLAAGHCVVGFLSYIAYAAISGISFQGLGSLLSSLFGVAGTAVFFLFC